MSAGVASHATSRSDSTSSARQFANGPLLTRKDFIDPDTATTIISSKHAFDGKWRQLTADTSVPGVTKIAVPVQTEGRLTVLTTVAPKTVVPRHAHSSGLTARYILSGSLKCNGIAYGPGDWMFVPKNVEYEISTETGYTALVEYDNCEACR